MTTAPAVRVVPTAPGADWRALVVRSLTSDDPGAPAASHAAAAEVLSRSGAGSRRLLWSATAPDGALVGAASLRLLDGDGQRHLATLDVHVDPPRRRRGAGRALVAAAVAAARADGRRAVVAGVRGGTAAEPFARACGWRPVLAVTRLVLDLADARLPDGAPDDGYRLARWSGAVPDDLAASFAAAKHAMADMPTGDMDYGTVAWDADRVRAMARAVLDRGDALLTVAALDGGGDVVAFTEVVVPGGAAERAQQYDTVVVPAHRGHGLGLRVKADMVAWLRAEWPVVAQVETDNADDNAHMVRVNEALGYRVAGRTSEYQADL